MSDGLKLSSALAERSKAKAAPGVLLPAVKEYMLGHYVGDVSRRADVIHPSELSHQREFCPRAVYLRLTEGPVDKTGEGFNFVTQNIFDEGHSIHRKWQDRMRWATPLFGNWTCNICGEDVYNTVEPERFGEAWSGGCLWDGGHQWSYGEITLNAYDEALLVGHADGGAWTTLAEFKSVGTGSVRIEAPEIFEAADGDLKKMWDGITRPFKTHVNQVDIYLWICKTRGLPFTSAEIIYESKWNQLVKNFTVDYDERRSTRLVDQAVAIKYAVDQQTEPACRFPGECANCKPYDDRRAVPVVRKRTVRTRR